MRMKMVIPENTNALTIPQRKATKCNVANILGMDGRVTPRSIAYAAVLVSFLTNSISTKYSHCSPP